MTDSQKAEVYDAIMRVVATGNKVTIYGSSEPLIGVTFPDGSIATTLTAIGETTAKWLEAVASWQRGPTDERPTS
jgi:hypothetical protein